jgi:A/G-specific adenine glycosylase
LPVKLKTVKVRERFLNYFLVTEGNTVLMNKRGDKDIWANMYDLPMVETPEMLPAHELAKLPEVAAIFGDELNIIEDTAVIKHILTHQRLFVRMVKTPNIPLILKENWAFIPVDNLPELALPKVIFILIKNIFNL